MYNSENQIIYFLPGIEKVAKKTTKTYLIWLEKACLDKNITLSSQSTFADVIAGAANEHLCLKILNAILLISSVVSV